jgi:hypothetical protein
MIGHGPESEVVKRRNGSPVLALSCRAGGADQCTKLGGERTQRGHAATAESDPERNLPRHENSRNEEY